MGTRSCPLVQTTDMSGLCSYDTGVVKQVQQLTLLASLYPLLLIVYCMQTHTLVSELFLLMGPV